MAHILSRKLSAFGRTGKYLFAGIVQGSSRDALTLARAPGQVTRVATLVVTNGEQLSEYEPWPYKEKKFNTFYEYLDNTSKRMNENSKVIIVEGNIGVGKSEFAKRLADHFGMKYFPPVQEYQCFQARGTEGGFDLRELNEFLPPSAQFYDLERFYSESNPQRGGVGKLQLAWYKRRCYAYQEALLHLFSTGQGVVIPRSVFGENAFVDAAMKMKYITPQFKKYYYYFRDNTICELLKPHLTIFLDVPPPLVRERISKRNDPREVGSSILSDEYVQAIHDSYQRAVLPNLRRTGEVVEVDWAEVGDDIDMDAIVEDLCTLELERQDKEDPKFQDWHLTEDDMCHYRKLYGGKELAKYLENYDDTHKCPEITPWGDDLAKFKKVVDEHPGICYEAGWAPELNPKINPYFRLW